MNDLKEFYRPSDAGLLRDILLLVVIFSIPFFIHLGDIPLMDPDEGRYAEIPREMLERADFITPTLNYVKYFEKPPLLYWLNAASIEVFGKNEFAVRFPSALCGLLTVLATYLIARRLYNRRTALISAFILGTSTGFLIQSRIILTDTLLTLCIVLALGSFIVASKREGRRKTSLWLLFYFFSALAVLAKGLIGILMPGVIILAYLLLTRKLDMFARMRILPGMLIFFAVSAPWFVAVTMANPEFPDFFFIHEHFQRFTSNVHSRYKPFWFFVPVLAVTMLPWSFFIPGALGRAWRNRNHENGETGLYLFLWFTLIFLFFSVSVSKLVPYMLPVFPPLAILIASRFSRAIDGRHEELIPALFPLGLTLIALGLAGVGYLFMPETTRFLSDIFPSQEKTLRNFLHNIPELSPMISITLGLNFLFQGIVVLASFRNPVRMLALISICLYALELSALQVVMPVIAHKESRRELALKAKSAASPDSVIATFGLMQGVSWYTERRVMIVGRPDELEFGSRQGDQSEWFPDMDRFLKLWRGERHLLLFLKKSELETLASSLVPPPRIVAESGRFVLISNR